MSKSSRRGEAKRVILGTMKRLGVCAGPLVVAAVFVSGSALAAATEVNTCGQVFSGNGFLSADLDCSGFAGDAVTIQGGTLDLRGFTLTAGSARGVFCEKSCTVRSEPQGGLVTGGSTGIRSAAPFTNNRAVNIRLIDAVVDSASVFGIDTERGKVTLINATVTNALTRGVTCTRARVKNSTVSGNIESGVSCSRAKITDSVISGNGIGVGGARINIKASMITGNLSTGIIGGKVKVTDSTVTGNLGPGIEATNANIKVIGCDISGNGEQGVGSGTVAIGGKGLVIRDSTITNNALEGVAHRSERKAKLTNVTITGNGLDGVFSIKGGIFPGGTTCPLIVTASTITGNGTDLGVCGVTQTCSDVSACELPKLSATTCDTSYDTNSGFPGTSWGLCALD